MYKAQAGFELAYGWNGKCEPPNPASDLFLQGHAPTG